MSKFYVVATPIGNLSDISLRALEVFKSVDTIVCEDTRVTGKLLSYYQIKKPLLSFHQHSARKTVEQIIDLLKQNRDLAYVSDAGTPGIQDPGNKLIATLLQSAEFRISNLEFRKKTELEIIPIPGASAITAIACVSGLPTDSFLFLGFLPKKKGKQKIFHEIVDSKRTAIFYESGHRILKTLEELNTMINDPSLTLPLARGEGRQIVIGRELTKKFETIYRGSIEEVLAQLNNSSIKGEFVVVVEEKK